MRITLFGRKQTAAQNKAMIAQSQAAKREYMHVHSNRQMLGAKWINARRKVKRIAVNERKTEAGNSVEQSEFDEKRKRVWQAAETAQG